MNPTETKLRNLLAYFENGAASIRATLGFLESMPGRERRNGHTNGNGHGAALPDVMQSALELDEKRRAKRKGPAPTRGKGHTAEKLQRRAETAKLLARFDTETPRTTEELKIGGYGITTAIRWGYLKRKGGGLVRTSKPFAVDWREEQ